ncbi:MAG TPA: acyl-CoA dehydrogenase family protein [Acidimicrobiales bacterium]|nr:acyl-CoA dehydrogenase family protein [Acidimicrobiales bacterium]
MIGLSDEHVELATTVRRWAQTHCPPSLARSYLDGDAAALPPFWSQLPDLGWLELDFPELVVVVEELGRAMAPGPFVPTAIANAVTGRVSHEPVAVTLEGTIALCGPGAVALVGPGVDTTSFSVEPLGGLDPTRSIGRVAVDVDPADARARDGAALVLSAEAVGLAAWCVDTAAAYAKVREQFGRPIGQFQAVKHRCADMLVALELARGAVWDAARAPSAFTVGVAAALATAAAVQCANDCIQVLGGIGFTWEHDAHLYLKRALSIDALLGGSGRWNAAVARRAMAGERRELRVDLGPEAEPFRDSTRAFIATLEKGRRRAQMADAGYITPHWPAPWGKDAGPIEQLAIAEEFAAAGVRPPHLQVGAWALPTIIEHGTPGQQERFIGPTLRGELSWCQLFSEPGAGSDLAALSTKAARARRAEGAQAEDDGWLLSGQKVWTSMAQDADWGICLARTDSDRPKHEGITCFLVDMKSPGVDVRPLRELTGASLFNEVFLSDVFVPDDCVVGAVNDGWRAGRTTLANERVSMGAGAGIGPNVDALLSLLPTDADTATLERVGEAVVESQALAVLGVRLTRRALAGADAGPEASIRKLVGAEHDQRVQELGLAMLGPDGAAVDGRAAPWINGLLWSRCLTIAGGTSDIQRNVIAERLLGLPKDP